MKTSLVIGGAVNVYEDIARALAMFTPDAIIAVKDIGLTYPRVDHWVTYHIDRMSRELGLRRSANLPDPECLWTHKSCVVPKALSIPIRKLEVKGGSSGFLGVLVGLEVSDRVVLAGIPMDPQMTHFYKRKHGKPWHEGRVYQAHWNKHAIMLRPRVRSMSGWTMKLLGEPTLEWLQGAVEQVNATETMNVPVSIPAPAQTAPLSSKERKRAQARALAAQQN